MSLAADPLGLIAGAGRLPHAVAAGARRLGRRVSLVALTGVTDATLANCVDEVCWVGPGEAGRALSSLLSSGAREAVMVGKVPKQLVLGAGDEALDPLAGRELGTLPERRDDTLLARVAEVLQRSGIRVLPQALFVPELLPGEGALGAVEASGRLRADAEFGVSVARAIGAFDIGQTVVVKSGVVLAVEAMEGTDAAIRRAGALAPGGCVVKVAKPGQDPRFDMPAIGPDTISALVDAGATGLAFEAGSTLVVERDELVGCADRQGIAVFGVVAPVLARATGGGGE